MEIKTALKEASALLSWVENPQKEAALLLCEHLHVERTWLLLHEREELKDIEGYFSLVERRKAHEPLEYILGKASFYGRDFLVDAGVLVPRPETELLVDAVVALLGEYPSPRILEVGVGSGVISVMLALLFPSARIVATDISPKALENAQKNARLFGVDGRICFVETSYMEGVAGAFDVLVSNPPYIARDVVLETHVLKEPHAALFGGEKGDEMLKELLKRTQALPIAHVACEMGWDQRASMQEYLEALGAKEIVFYQDLAGLDRGFCARMKEYGWDV